MSAEADRSTKRRRRIRLWHVPVAIVVIVVVAMLVLRWHWKRDLRGRIAAIAAAGYPVTPAELGEWYPAPTSGQNGAQAVLDAASGYVDELSFAESESLKQLFRLGRRDQIDEEAAAALKRLVADNQKMLERLHAAARFDHHHYDIDWSGTTGWEIEPLERTADALLLLQRSALLAFEEGRIDDAIDSIVTLSVISRSLAEIPTLGAYFRVGRSRDSIIGSLERGMDRMVLTDRQLQRVQAALGADDTPATLERALAGHMCMLLPYFEKPASQVPDAPLPPGPVLEVYEALGLAAREACVVVEAMESYMEVTRRPLREWPSEANVVDTAFEAKFFGCLVIHSDGGFKLSHILLHHLRSTARLRAARATLAVERYSLAHGALPSSLEDLVAEYLGHVPWDPFTGEKLRYEQLGKGFVVYSVGADGRDDGGWEVPPRDRRTGGQTYDITFTVER